MLREEIKLPEFLEAVYKSMSELVDQEVNKDFTLLVGKEPIQALLNTIATRGKLNRTKMLVLGASLGAQVVDDEDLFRIAIGTELFQAFALIHDDVMDNDSLRRGAPTLHCQIKNSGASNGEALAILLGNYILALSDELFMISNVGNAKRSAISRVYAELKREVIYGQALDLYFEKQYASLSPSIVEEIILRKTIGYSFTKPLLIGCILSGTARDTLKSIVSLISCLGKAYQLVDDLKGSLSAPSSLGKSDFSDIYRWKPTLLLCNTKARLDSPESRELTRLMGLGSLSDEQLEWIQTAMLTSGAANSVCLEIRNCLDEASRIRNSLDLKQLEEKIIDDIHSPIREYINSPIFTR